MNNILKLSNVDKYYKNPNGKLYIYEDVNMEIEKGKVYALTGVSGSGKSTFLNLVGGFDYVSSGSIFLNNIDITKKDEQDLANIRNRHLGYIFQSFHLIPELSVVENVMLPNLKLGFSRKESYKKAIQLLEKVGIKEKAENSIYMISGGESQRVAIARALINNPEIVLADEPTGNLDQGNRDNVLQILIDIVRQMDKSIIIATHNKDIANKCDIVYTIEDRNIKKID